jgi:hypothetical protein
MFNFRREVFHRRFNLPFLSIFSFLGGQGCQIFLGA